MKKFLTFITTALLSLSLVACGSSQQTEQQTTDATTSQQSSSNTQEDSALAKIKQKGELVVATSPDYPPYEFKTIENGKEKVVGFDISIAEEIAKDMGVDLHILELDFSGLLVSLNANKADLVMAGMSPNPEREKAVDFSDVYYTAEQAILIKSENNDEFTSVDSLSGKKIGVQKGSIQETLALEQLPNSKIVFLNKLTNLILDLKAGNVDAVIVETPVAEGYVKQYPDLTISSVKTKTDVDGCAIAIKKGNQDLVDQVNSTLRRLEEDGSMDKFFIEANELLNNIPK